MSDKSELKDNLVPIKVMIIGETGVGKTTLINKLYAYYQSDKRVIIRHSKKSDTQHCTRHQMPNFVFCDTPGFNDTEKPNEVIFSLICEELIKLEPNVIIWILNGTLFRLTRKELCVWEAVNTLIPRSYRDSVIAVLAFCGTEIIKQNLREEGFNTIVESISKELVQNDMQIMVSVTKQMASDFKLGTHLKLVSSYLRVYSDDLEINDLLRTDYEKLSSESKDFYQQMNCNICGLTCYHVDWMILNAYVFVSYYTYGHSTRLCTCHHLYSDHHYERVKIYDVPKNQRFHDIAERYTKDSFNKNSVRKALERDLSIRSTALRRSGVDPDLLLRFLRL